MVTREDAFAIVKARGFVGDQTIVRELSAKRLVAEIVGKNEVAVYFEKSTELDVIQDYCEANGLSLRV